MTLSHSIQVGPQTHQGQGKKQNLRQLETLFEAIWRIGSPSLPATEGDRASNSSFCTSCHIQGQGCELHWQQAEGKALPLTHADAGNQWEVTCWSFRLTSQVLFCFNILPCQTQGGGAHAHLLSQILRVFVVVVFYWTQLKVKAPTYVIMDINGFSA